VRDVIYSLLADAAGRFGTAPALYFPSAEKSRDKRERNYQTLNWIEYRAAVDEVALGLHELGVRRGDIVAIDAETSLEFYLADLGTLAIGAIAAALYTSYPPPEHVETLRRLKPKAVFVESPRMLAALLSAAEPPFQEDATRWILLTGEPGADSAVNGNATTLAKLRASGREALRREPNLLSSVTDQVQPSDPAILYLTSGATGAPKMGLANHGSLVENVNITPKVVDIGPNDRSIAFLPSAHITQRVAMELLPIRVGMPVWFSEGLSRLPLELKAVRPTFLVAPPRVWERMYSSICAEIKKRHPLMQRVFWGALGVGSEIVRRRQAGQDVPGWMTRAWKLADGIVFSKIRERMGGELRLAISGAAPLGKDLADFYGAIGMPIHEGYGLTEGGIVALNPIGKAKNGSIGKAFPGVDMKIADDGELIFRSPTLFAGYYQDPEATAAILRDGWLHTGDIAEIDKDGYIYITGRKKEVIVSSNGKKIYPAQIEALFKMEPVIHQTLLVGDKLPYVAALFTLNRPVLEMLDGVMKEAEMKEAPMEQLVAHPAVVAEIKRVVAKVNKQLAPFEQVRKYSILPRDFTIEAGEMTPTMKVRRTRVLENHRKAVAELYGNRADGGDD